MTARFVFPSLKEPNHRYVVYKNWSDNPTNGKGFSERVTAYDTYGDGNIQHCHEWSVQNDLETYTDFLESFLVAVASRNESEWSECLEFWPSPLHEKNTRALMDFAAELVCKDDGKHRYFNLNEQKQSASDNKRHDKRWKSLDGWMDGTFQAFMGITCEEHNHGLLRMYHWMQRAFEVVDKFSHYDAMRWLKIESEPWRRVWNAFEACDDLIQAVRRVDAVRKWTKSRAENITNRLQAHAESAATVETV